MVSPRRLDTWPEEENTIFRDQAVFTGLWVLVLLVGIKTLTTLRYILQPLIWAFFLMMALLPFTDLVECCLLRSVASFPFCVRVAPCGAKAEDLRKEAHELERQYSGIESTASRRRGGSSTRRRESESRGRRFDSTDVEGRCGWARMIASMVTVAVFTGAVTLYGVMMYKSAYHMKSTWHNYETGAQRLLDKLSAWKDKLPEELVDKMVKKALGSIEEVLSDVLGSALEHLTFILVELFMTLLYMVFWLCRPVFVGETITALFKRYILLKTVASAMYASCIWLLLQALQIDLAIVFGLVAFMLNFVPEVGPIVAIFLPLPLILFDGRLPQPILTMTIALVGQLFLKFVFANIVEVKLVERQNDFRMHPVTILFFVAFFGRIWGATGMLVSVPVMAAAKAATVVMPALYRDPILVFLEGDRDAPKRFRST